MWGLETCLEFLELLIKCGQLVCLFQLGGLLLQVGELVVEVWVALYRRLRLVVFKELAGLGFSRALQVGPALSNLLQLLLNNWTKLWLLLDQLLTLLEIESGNCYDSGVEPQSTFQISLSHGVPSKLTYLKMTLRVRLWAWLSEFLMFQTLYDVSFCLIRWFLRAETIVASLDL